MQISTKFWSVVSIATSLLAVPLHAEGLYIANTDTDSIYAYGIRGTGALYSIQGSPFHSGQWPVSVAVDSMGHFLFTANMGADTISAYSIATNGSLTRLPDTKAGSMPKSVAVDPIRRLLFVTNLDGTGIPGNGGTVGHVRVYRIGATGSLTQVPGSPFSAGFSPLSVQADPVGGFVYVGNAGSQVQNNVSGYRVAGNGSLVSLPGSPYRDGEAPQSLAVDALGRFLYTAGEYDLALQTYRVASNGILTYLPGSSFHPGGGYQPWNAVVTDPFGRFVYTSSGEELNPANAIFSIYRVGTNGLTFASSYPAGFISDAMVVEFTGQFFYAAVNVVKGTQGPVEGTALAVYRITGTGSLTLVPGTPYQLGFSPDSIATSP